MNALVLVGASGLARETIAAARASDPYIPVHVVDDDRDRWWARHLDVRVIGGLDLVPDLVDHGVAVTIGRGRARRAVVGRLDDYGVPHDRYASVVHPRVSVAADCSLGRGCVLLSGVVLTADVRVGDHVVVMPHVTLTHDCVVDDFATLCAGVSLGGGVLVGSGAYVGMNASVREGVRVGRDATLGMGSVLLEDLPDGETWAGVPARPLREPASALQVLAPRAPGGLS